LLFSAEKGGKGSAACAEELRMRKRGRRRRKKKVGEEGEEGRKGREKAMAA